MFKKACSLVICLCLMANFLGITPAVAATATVQKEISLLDLSGIPNGVINQKGNSQIPTALSNIGVMNFSPCWGVSHGFNGTQEIVTVSGKKAWKINFDVPMASQTWINDISNEVSVKLAIPENFIPYVTAIKLDIIAKPSEGSLQYKFGISNQTTGIGSLSKKIGVWEDGFNTSSSQVSRTITHNVTDLYKLNLSTFYSGATSNLSSKWSKGNATDVFLMFTNSGCKGTGGSYVLVKDIKMVINVPADQYSADLTESFRYENRDMLADFEALTNGGKFYNKTNGSFEEINNSGMIITSKAALERYGLTANALTLENIKEWSAKGHNISDWIYVSENRPSAANDIFEYTVKITNLGVDLRKENVVFKSYIDFKDQNVDTIYETFEGTLDRVVYGEKYREKFYAKYGCNYTGTMESITSVDYGNKIFGDAVWQDIVNKGFDHIRLPINLSSCVDSKGTVSEEQLLKLDRVLNLAIRNGLSVVLDLHGLANVSGNYNGYHGLYENVWNQLATRYAALPESVAFQIINEPSTQRTYDSKNNKDPMTYSELMAMQERIIRSFRKIHGNENRLAVIGADTNGYWAYSKFTSSLRSLDNLIVDFHFYEPMSFTHSGAEWSTNADGSPKYPANATDYSSMNPASAFQKGVDFKKKNPNIKYVWMGEWGVYKAEYNAKVSYFAEVAEIARQYNIPWAVWFGAGSPGNWDTNILSKMIK